MRRKKIYIYDLSNLKVSYYSKRVLYVLFQNVVHEIEAIPFLGLTKDGHNVLAYLENKVAVKHVCITDIYYYE